MTTTQLDLNLVLPGHPPDADVCLDALEGEALPAGNRPIRTDRRGVDLGPKRFSASTQTLGHERRAGLARLSLARVGMALALILLIPGLATLWTAWDKLTAPTPPAPLPLSLAGLGALVVNLFCAFMLTRYRTHQGSLTRAAFLSARNDAVANVAIVGAGLVTVYTLPAWPDLIVGLGIVAINADAAREVWTAARTEHLNAEA